MKAVLPHPDRRVLRTVFNGRNAWVKYASVKPRRRARFVQSVLSRLFRLQIARSSFICDANKALQFETRRLREMRDLGFFVPDVLKVDADKILLSDVGVTLAKALRQIDDADIRFSVMNRAVYHLGVVHAYGQYHGRPSLKDMTIGKKGIGFIDLEHNPLSVMSLREAQARDFFLFLFQASAYQKDIPNLLLRLYETYKRVAPTGVLKELYSVSEHVEFSCRIVTGCSRFFSGSDLKKCVVMGEFMKQTFGVTEPDRAPLPNTILYPLFEVKSGVPAVR